MIFRLAYLSKGVCFGVSIGHTYIFPNFLADIAPQERVRLLLVSHHGGHCRLTTGSFLFDTVKTSYQIWIVGLKKRPEKAVQQELSARLTTIEYRGSTTRNFLGYHQYFIIYLGRLTSTLMANFALLSVYSWALRWIEWQSTVSAQKQQKETEQVVTLHLYTVTLSKRL